MGTKLSPGDFDCYASAMDDEPMFVLLARDPLAASVVRKWAERYINRKALSCSFGPEEQRKFDEAMRCSENMEAWRELHPEV